MTLLGALLCLGYLAIGVVVTLYVSRQRFIAVWLPMLLCTGLVLILNVSSYFYFLLTGDRSLFLNLSISEVTLGLAINLVFLVFWLLGYVGLLRRWRPRSPPAPRSYVAPKVALILFAITSGVALWYFRQNLSYTYSQSLYLKNIEEAGTFGAISAFLKIFGPLAAAYLVYSHRALRSGTRSSFLRRPMFRWVMWGSLGFLVVSGLFAQMQRGRIIEPLLLVGYVMTLNGATRKALKLAAVAGVFVLLASPVLDLARAPSTSRGGISSLEDAYRAVYSSGETLGPTILLYEAARKSLLPVSAAAMYRHTSETGHVGFATYPSIIEDVIPRFVYPEKPFPLSSDGTAWGRPIFITGVELGLPGVTFWDAGGAVMYWQFGWLGVVLGGLAVGFLWAWLARAALCGSSFFLLVLFFSMLGWGLFLFESLDFLLHRFLVLLRIVGPFWLAAVLLRAVAGTYPRAPRGYRTGVPPAVAHVEGR